MSQPKHTCWRTGTHNCAGCDEDQRVHEWLQDHPDDEQEHDE